MQHRVSFVADNVYQTVKECFYYHWLLRYLKCTHTILAVVHFGGYFDMKDRNSEQPKKVFKIQMAVSIDSTNRRESFLPV